MEVAFRRTYSEYSPYIVDTVAFVPHPFSGSFGYTTHSVRYEPTGEVLGTWPYWGDARDYALDRFVNRKLPPEYSI